jgi:hypothetical protein
MDNFDGGKGRGDRAHPCCFPPSYANRERIANCEFFEPVEFYSDSGDDSSLKSPWSPLSSRSCSW